MSDYILTYSKTKFYPLEPIAEDIKIKDIDDSMLYYEFIEIMDKKISDEKPYISMKHNFSQRDFKSVEKEFFKKIV